MNLKSLGTPHSIRSTPPVPAQISSDSSPPRVVGKLGGDGLLVGVTGTFHNEPVHPIPAPYRERTHPGALVAGHKNRGGYGDRGADRDSLERCRGQRHRCWRLACGAGGRQMLALDLHKLQYHAYIRRSRLHKPAVAVLEYDYFQFRAQIRAHGSISVNCLPEH